MVAAIYPRDPCDRQTAADVQRDDARGVGLQGECGDFEVRAHEVHAAIVVPARTGTGGGRKRTIKPCCACAVAPLELTHGLHELLHLVAVPAIKIRGDALRIPIDQVDHGLIFGELRSALVSSGLVAGTKEKIKHRRRVLHLWNRNAGTCPRNRIASPHPEAERGKPGQTAAFLLHQLVQGYAPLGEPWRLLATHSAEERMHSIVAPLHTRMLQLRKDRHPLAPALERLQHRSEFKRRPLTVREEHLGP